MQISTKIIPGVRKIAVLRANAVGDYVYSIPALEALRAAYPVAEIVLLGRDWHAQFLKGRPGPVDRIMVTPLSQGVNVPSQLEDDHWEEDSQEVEQFFARARQEAFDLAIQLHGGGRYSNPFVMSLGARVTAGMKTTDAPPLDHWLPYQYWQNEILRLLECVALVGADPVTIYPRLEVIPSDRAEIEELIPDTSLQLAVIHAGATDSRRRWGENNFSQLADWLTESGFTVVLIGMLAESKINQMIKQLMRHPVIDLAGRISLNGVVGLLERACVLIGNDSGPIHLAEAIGAPSVGLYWAGNMINFGPPAVAFHRQLLSWQIECPVCGRHMVYDACDHKESLVKSIPVQSVIDEVQDVVAYAQKVSV